MFWKREKESIPTMQSAVGHPYRFAIIYISERFKHVMFVSQGRTEIGLHAELDDILSDTWPCDFGKLQDNIVEALNRYKASTEFIKGNWPSYKNSKAKTQKSFEVDYISILLQTDLSKAYEVGEVDRIEVTALPSLLESTYSLTGTGHLIDTKVAQIVVDIFETCIKPRR